MGIKLFMGISLFPVLLIMYAMVLGMEKNRKGILFGVSLWEGATEQDEVKEIQKNYHKSMKKYMLLALVLFLITFVPKHFSIFISMQIFWIFFAIGIAFIPFVKANKRILQIKQEYQKAAGKESEETGQTVYVDMEAAIVEKPVYFKKTVLGAIFAALLPAVAEFLRVKWNLVHIPAAPDLWLCELVLLSLGGVTILCLALLYYCKKAATKAFFKNSQVNIQIARIKQYQWSRLAGVLAWATAVFNWLILFSFYMESERMVYLLLISSIVYMIVTIGVVYQCWLNIQRNVEKYISKEGYQIEDDDRNWIWGIFYYNKNDNRFMVEQRIGMGFTTNMAKKSARILTIVVTAVTAVFLVAMCAWIILEDFTPIGLSYEDGNLMAVHWKEEYTIPSSEIKSIELWQEQPRLSKRNGTGMDTVRKGDFFSREYERSFQLCLNPQAGPYLMVKTKDDVWYLLGSNTGEEIPGMYEEITKDIGVK